ncbi:hypothetical protein [Thauera sp. SDU_THAU2]
MQIETPRDIVEVSNQAGLAEHRRLVRPKRRKRGNNRSIGLQYWRRLD